jgi:hypothetical protein
MRDAPVDAKEHVEEQGEDKTGDKADSWCVIPPPARLSW